MTARLTLVILVAASVCLALAPQIASAHGGEEAEVTELSMQPARVLAQQALAELEVRNDAEEAAVRLDAALESEDQSDIDLKLLNQATETLDGGDPEGAVALLDEALSRPLGAASGKALHESGREFQPATGAQEVVGIALGAALLVLGGALLLRGRLHRPA
jgi:LPXTG-motif cell wall-anchored protein